MKSITLSILFFVLLNADSYSQLSGPHGGIMKKSGDHYIEINSAPAFYTWLLDKDTVSISNENILCDVRFFFADNTILDTRALPFGTDGFYLENTGGFISCLVSFNVFGRIISARFENITSLVNEKNK